MPVKKYTVQDGVFVHEHTTASIKDTPTKEFGEGLKRVLAETARNNTPGYILEQSEKYARARLEAPRIERKKGQKLTIFQKELKANERQRHDCESLLREVDFLKTISERKDTNHDFLMVCFYHLGVLAQQADIRPIEPFFETGKSNVDGGKTGGHKSGILRKEKAKPIHKIWQAEANKIWSNHPELSNAAVEKIIKKKSEIVKNKIGGRPGTIRKTIKKPLP